MTPLVLKVGGALLKNDQDLAQFFSALTEIEQPILMVHGGGVWLDQRFEENQWPITKCNGKRVTPFSQIHAVVEVLAGKVNKHLLSMAVEKGLNPIGLTLSEGQTLSLTADDPILEAVAVPEPRDPELLSTCLEHKWLPILSCVGMSDQGQWFNVNADDAAVAIAELLNADLALLSDVPAVLNGNQEPISSLDQKQINTLIESGIIQGGMEVKVNGALKAAKTLNKPVWIGSWKYPLEIAKLCAGDKNEDVLATAVVPS